MFKDYSALELSYLTPQESQSDVASFLNYFLP